LQAVRQQKVEYRNITNCSTEEHRFVLCFLLGRGVLEKEGSSGFRLSRGEAVMLSEEGKYTFRAEDAIVITFAMQELRELPLSGENMVSLLSLLKIERGPKSVMVYFRDLSEGFLTRAFDLVEEYGEQKLFREPILTYELAGLLLRLTRHIWRAVTIRQESDPERTRKMLNYMLAHYKDASLEEMAAEFNYHPNTAAGLLKKNTGKTFSELLLEIRMARVTEALRRGSSVNDAAAECGYSNMSNFYRRFKQYYGKTPAEMLKAEADKEGSC